MTIVHEGGEGNDYKHVYTIDTRFEKRKALRAFLSTLYTELLEEKRQPCRLLYLKSAWDMLKGHNTKEFNIIANRIKPGRELSLFDFLAIVNMNVNANTNTNTRTKTNTSAKLRL